jgi:hypothetical protein
MIALEIEEDEVEKLLAARADSAMRSTFHVTCVCGREIITSERTGWCRFCARMFDLTAWGT